MSEALAASVAWPPKPILDGFKKRRDWDEPARSGALGRRTGTLIPRILSLTGCILVLPAATPLSGHDLTLANNRIFAHPSSPAGFLESHYPEKWTKSESAATRMRDDIDPLLHVIRHDRMILMDSAGICISTYIDKRTLELVESSGENLGLYLESYSRETASALEREFQARNLPIYLSDKQRSRRILALVQRVGEADCVRAPNAIRVKQEVVPGDLPEGYRVRLTAAQGARHYEAQIVRPYAVVISAQGRPLIPLKNPKTPDGAPYWDVRLDLSSLRAAFIQHLFHDGTGK